MVTECSAVVDEFLEGGGFEEQLGDDEVSSCVHLGKKINRKKIFFFRNISNKCSDEDCFSDC